MKITIQSTNKYFNAVLEYIFFLEKSNIENIRYLEEILYTTYRFGRMKEDKNKRKIIIPDVYDNLNINYNNTVISSTFQLKKNNYNDYCKILKENGCGSSSEKIIYELILFNDDSEILISFIDSAKKYVDDYKKEFIKKSNDSNRIYCYHDYWSLFSKTPIRNENTIYLKKDQFTSLCDDISDFLSESTQKEYLKYGIPYKKVYLLYGVPGSGKTSTINAVASKFNSDVFILPMSNEITDTTFIDAIGSIYRSDDSNLNSNHKILVLEDIDCLFEDRKQGDSNKSNLSLQNLLNTLDGFTTLNGTITFVTANNVNSLDDAMIRCCRIDKCIHYDYADKYQTYNILEAYIPNDKHIHDTIYKSIHNKKFTIAMLQRFLFDNRKSVNILDNLKSLHEIIDLNIKSTNNSLYL